MPASQHLTKLTYLFEVVADEDAPDQLKSDILDYLHGTDGLTRAMAALQPIENGDDARFEGLANRARPIAQATRVYDVISAFADELPETATLKQTLTFAAVARGHYLDQTGQGELHRAASLAKDTRLPTNLNHTLWGQMDALFKAVKGNDGRSTYVKLSPKGVALLRRVLHRMRVAQQNGDGLGVEALGSPVESITDHIRNGR